MRRDFWLVAPLCLLLIAVTYMLLRDRPDLYVAKTDLVASGYHCTSDRQDGLLEFGFMITREPARWDDVGAVMKIGSVESDWRGKVWVAKMDGEMQLRTTPDTGGVRIWGNVVAFGDRKFLDEIELQLRRVS